MAGIVVIFDFDKTIIDIDSDNWVIDGLGGTALFERLLTTMPWNSAMDAVMKEFHSQGKTIEDIVAILKQVPIHPRVVPAIKAAHSLGCELRIVSDANLFYIETILNHLGISQYFSEINTNPGFVDEEGKLRILPYVDFLKAPHGCSNVCPPNMCKGMIIERIQSSLEKNEKIIYLGDGAGDYCPMLKLGPENFVMPRKNFPVWSLISENRDLVKAKIHEWTDGQELEQILLGLIASISEEEKRSISSAQLFSSDCGFQTIAAMHGHEALPRALPVRH
ncbi:inorganic pyrophosphatase 1 [Daucus carota subsp. sativus]|uniref:inorganic pyrophosphatase 1 n=1 Tax=Daucus carota subsp. sativus TaxID=79200 RepID=UPI0007EF96F0|nr:PREDICTED: inorganic pyrophosphatase 1-like [Daucus carota subsp. sativus]